MTLNIEVFEKKPEGFAHQVEVASCYIEIEGKLLLLQSTLRSQEQGKWGVPAGKLEKGETPENAAKRELFEETGIYVQLPSQIHFIKSLYIRKPDVSYIYHMFKVQLNQTPNIRLSEEHQNYAWATPKDLEEIPLMAGAHQALKNYRTSLTKKRPHSILSSYLILKQDDNVLFQLRKNTNYCDGMWGLVAGHVEEGESATSAMIREAREEIGIELLPSQIRVVHVMHRQTNRFNIDVFFDCTSWEGVIKNLEPEKCEKMEFFTLDALPKNTVDYHISALKAILNKEAYSEQGWNT